MGVVLSLDDGKRQSASIGPLMGLTKADMGRVNELILSKAGSDVELIPEVANHLVSSGGKRLRPMITLAAAKMFGYEGDCDVKLATSVEFMHTATLLHDDVVDESALRRGRATARMIWGNQASVLVGDFLLGQAFRMMVEVGSLDALDVLSAAATIIAEGEVMQLAAAQNLGTTEDEYLAVIRAKTAALFSAAAEVGPIIADASSPQYANRPSTMATSVPSNNSPEWTLTQVPPRITRSAMSRPGATPISLAAESCHVPNAIAVSEPIQLSRSARAARAVHQKYLTRPRRELRAKGQTRHNRLGPAHALIGTRALPCGCLGR